MTEVPQTSQSDPDLLLIRAMAQGNRNALSELYARHGNSILAYLMGQMDDRQQAEEVLQDVMLAAWDHAADFRAESKVKTWLLAIARRKAINVWRRKHPVSTPLYEETISDSDTGLLKRVVHQDEEEQVRQALKALSDDHRETLELIFYHGVTGVEAAEILGVSPGTIKSRLHRAKNQLRGLLQRKEVGDEW